jgi:hypothetical protein
MVMKTRATRFDRMGRRTSRQEWDDYGQVSFSVIAVVLLVSSAIAGTYIANDQLGQVREERRLQLVAAMEDALDDIREEVSLCAAQRAQAVMDGWDEYPINETRISEAFADSVREYVAYSFPRSSGKYSTDVANWTGGLYFVERNTLDLVPADSTVKDSCEVDGEEVEYDRLPGPHEEILSTVTCNPYYVAVGNFSAKISTGAVSLSRSISFQRPIISALPFLESKLRLFEESSSGECSDLGRLVGDMLSTLAQLRVLEGYGQPMYVDGANTSQVLTEADVFRAVAVGLLIEQTRLFRTTDPAFASEVAGACGGPSPGLDALQGSKGRMLEPNELFLWFLGRTTAAIDPTVLVAEALYGIVDQLVLKFMEYMGWLGALDLAHDVVGGAVATVDSIIAHLTGEDRAKNSVTSWISRALGSCTSDPANCTLMFSPLVDCIVPITERVYYVEDSSGTLYPVWIGNFSASVDVPQYDLISSDTWKDFYPDFKECQTDIKKLAEDSVMRMAFDLASSAQVEVDGFTIDPADGKDMFEQLATGTGSIDLLLDPDSVTVAGRNLPLFSAQYELATRLSEFMCDRHMSLIDFDTITQGGFDSIAELALDSARYSYIPDLVVPVEQQLKDIVRADVEHDSQWGVGQGFVSRLTDILEFRLAYVSRMVNLSVYRVDDKFAGPLVDSLVSMLAYGASEFPGLEEMIEQSLDCFVGEILAQNDLSSWKRSAYVDNSAKFEFWEGDKQAAESRGSVLEESVSVEVVNGLPEMQAVPYAPSAGYTSLEHLFPTNDLLVQVERPWDFDRDRSEYPNTHLTDLSNASATPYSTQWTVSVLGMIELRTKTNNSEFASVSSGCALAQLSVRVELSFPVVVHSAWPLQGVEYNPTNTAISDALDAARKFVDIIWDKIGPAVGWLKDGLERLYGFVTKAFDVLANFANRVIKSVTSALESLVENMQAFVQKVADSALARAVQVFIDLVGRVEFRISLYGFIVIVQTNLPDLLYKHGSDMLRVMLYTDRLGPGLTLGVRIARLSDGSYDILANGTIALKSMKIDVEVDPLMHILRRFVEAHCTGKGWALDLVIPDLDAYELCEVSTSDIPVVGDFMSNIPIPALGLSASIEAGMKLKYSSPFPLDIVINEFESNPHGEDDGKEWVELYNPLDKPKVIDGWSLSTSHGKNSELDLSGTIPPNGVEVYTFRDVSLDNGNPDDPFNDGDSIILKDAAGVMVDVTPMLRDTSNDERTNQRSWDGGPKWVFRDGSRDNSNGLPVLLASSDFIAKALFEAIKESFLETKLEEVTASLDFVCLFAKRVLNNFIENLLALVKEIIHEVIFYIEVTISDATGSAGVGFRASFIVSGEAIVDLLRWLIHSIATFVVNLGRMQHPLAYPEFPKEFFSGLYLRFEALFEIGLPKIMKVIGAVSEIRDRYALVLSISPNLPAIGRLLGRDWGNWSVDFGAYLESVPRDFGKMLFTTDSGGLMDFWLVKGRMYGT